MSPKDKENFDIDFKNNRNDSADDDTELSIMNFSLSAKSQEPSREDRILSDLDKMSIFDFTEEKEDAQRFVEEVPVEAVSEQEIPEEETEMPAHGGSETLAEYSEEPHLDMDDIEINVVSWGQPRQAAAAPAEEPEQKKPIFIDDTKPAKPLPRSDEEVEIKLCAFRQSAAQKAQRAKEKQKKN